MVKDKLVAPLIMEEKLLRNCSWYVTCYTHIYIIQTKLHNIDEKVYLVFEELHNTTFTLLTVTMTS